MEFAHARICLYVWSGESGGNVRMWIKEECKAQICTGVKKKKEIWG